MKKNTGVAIQCHELNVKNESYLKPFRNVAIPFCSTGSIPLTSIWGKQMGRAIIK